MLLTVDVREAESLGQTTQVDYRQHTYTARCSNENVPSVLHHKNDAAAYTSTPSVHHDYTLPIGSVRDINSVEQTSAVLQGTEVPALPRRRNQASFGAVRLQAQAQTHGANYSKYGGKLKRRVRVNRVSGHVEYVRC